MTLQELSLIHGGTDKENYHHYFSRIYSELLSPYKETFTKICEIGVGTHHFPSLKIWSDYFINAQILGLDIVNHPKDNLPSNIDLQYLDQSNIDSIKSKSKELNNYDLILDDGSHLMYDQQITLSYFINSLKPGGIYILEDLHTSLDVKNNPNSIWGKQDQTLTLDMLKGFIKNKKIESNLLTQEEALNLEQSISSIDIYDEKSNSITSIIIKK